MFMSHKASDVIKITPQDHVMSLTRHCVSKAVATTSTYADHNDMNITSKLQ
jgi:hypothetical protein